MRQTVKTDTVKDKIMLVLHQTVVVKRELSWRAKLLIYHLVYVLNIERSQRFGHLIRIHCRFSGHVQLPMVGHQDGEITTKYYY